MRRLLAPLLALSLLGTPAALAREESLEPGKVHALETTRHARAWSLYVPSKYSRKSSWPLVLSSHGRGGDGAGEMRAWQSLANQHGFLVACPDMVTATNHRQPKSSLPPATEDDEVLLSIFEQVCGAFRVNRRAVMVTGFSGGGNPSYHSGLRHPEVFTHICTRGGNFAPQQIPTDEAVLAAGRKSLQIYIFFGDADHELIIGDQGNNGQAYMARDALEKAGYAHVTFERVDGMKHESRPQMAAAWFGAYLEENRKAFKEGDKADALLEKAQEALGREKYKDAIAALEKALEIERKWNLRPAAQGRLDAIEKIGQELLVAAGLALAADRAGARKTAERVARDFRGLPAALTAQGLLEEWKD